MDIDVADNNSNTANLTINQENKTNGTHQSCNETENSQENCELSNNEDANGQEDVEHGVQEHNSVPEHHSKPHDVQNNTEHHIEVEIMENINKINEDNIESNHKTELDAYKEEETSDLNTSRNENVIILGNNPPSTDHGEDFKKKTKWDRELERLGNGDLKEDDGEFDVYADDNNTMYRKHRLRKGAKPDYRIPTSIHDPKTGRRPSQENFRCWRCNKDFFSKQELRRHHRITHDITYTCSLCSLKFYTNSELICHKSIHDSENRTFICTDCDQSFTSHCEYLLHSITHAKRNKIFKCLECNQKYKKRSYEVHIYTHFSKLVSCPICNKQLNGVHNFRQHMNKHVNKFECVECGTILHDKKEFDGHMAIHTGVKLFQCLYCGKGFRLSQQRSVHTRIHTNEKPFTCKVCDKKFAQSTDLKRHVEISHGNRQKIECEICERKVWDITAHMKLHKSLRYSCTECEKKFATAASLKVHMLYIHSDYRPWVCELCDMKFPIEGQLKRHFNSKAHKRNEYKSSLGDDE